MKTNERGLTTYEDPVFVVEVRVQRGEWRVVAVVETAEEARALWRQRGDHLNCHWTIAERGDQ